MTLSPIKKGYIEASLEIIFFFKKKTNPSSIADAHQVIFVWLLVSAKAAFINFSLEAAKPQSIYLG